jgi:hypothetical protein
MVVIILLGYWSHRRRRMVRSQERNTWKYTAEESVTAQWRCGMG